MTLDKQQPASLTASARVSLEPAASSLQLTSWLAGLLCGWILMRVKCSVLTRLWCSKLKLQTQSIKQRHKVTDYH